MAADNVNQEVVVFQLLWGGLSKSIFIQRHLYSLCLFPFALSGRDHRPAAANRLSARL